MLLSIVLTLILVGLQRRAAAASGSVAVTADAAHYLGDVVVNGGIVLALLCSAAWGWTWIDPLVGLGVACYLLGLAWTVARLALVQLMDEELPPQERGDMEAVLRATPGVLGWHHLRTRRAGPQRFLQVHLEVDGSLSLESAHAITADAAQRLKTRFASLDVVIHADPVAN
jgi:ferrous-iron efflux pump FieF